MKFALLCKRHYTNKDLLDDQFGRLFHLPIHLVRLGHEGMVVAGDLHTAEKTTKQIRGVTFHSIPLSIFTLYPFIRNSHRILAKFKPEILIASGDSYLGYLGLRLAKKLKIPLVFDVYDDYTSFGSNRLLGMKSLFYKAAKNADLMITSSEPLQKKLQDFNQNIVVIENGYDPRLFRPIPKTAVRTNFNIPISDKVVGYFGSITKDLGIEVLLQAAGILRKHYPGLRLLLAGHNGINMDFKKAGTDYRGFLPQEKIPALINACDVVIIPYLPSKQVQQSNACKIAEYIACQVPIVVTKVSNHEEIFADAPQSLCNPKNPKSMADAILAQLKSPQVIKNVESLTWEKLASKLSYSLIDLLQKGSV